MDDDALAGVVFVDDHPPQLEPADVLGLTEDVLGFDDEKPPLDEALGNDGFDDEKPPLEEDLDADGFDDEKPPDERLLDEEDDERELDPVEPAWISSGARNDKDKINVVRSCVNLFMI